MFAFLAGCATVSSAGAEDKAPRERDLSAATGHEMAGAEVQASAQSLRHSRVCLASHFVPKALNSNLGRHDRWFGDELPACSWRLASHFVPKALNSNLGRHDRWFGGELPACSGAHPPHRVDHAPGRGSWRRKSGAGCTRWVKGLPTWLLPMQQLVVTVEIRPCVVGRQVGQPRVTSEIQAL